MIRHTGRDLLLAALVAAVTGAALVSLTRVFAVGTWRGPAVAALVAALAIATVARRAHPLVAALLSAAGLALFTHAVHLTPGPPVPDGGQLAELRALVDAAAYQARTEASPTLPLPGLMLLVTTGTWVVTHVTHELLVRWRKPGIALVPPAVLWAVPLSVPLAPGRTWPQALPFLAAAVVVLLVPPGAKVAGWVTDAPADRLSGAGLGIGAVAVIVAVALPGVVPGYGAGPWLDLPGTTDPRGYQPIVDVGDRLKLPQDRDVLEVRSERRVYLRLAALDTFDGVSWRLGPRGEGSYRPDPDSLFRTTGPLPPETPIRESRLTTVEVAVLDLENIYVPVPYQPVRIDGPHRDEMVYSTDGGFVATWQTGPNEIRGQLRVGVRDGFEYTVMAEVPQPSVAQLRNVELADAPDRYTRLPQEYPELTAAAEEVYAAAGATTAIDRALALQAWFAGPQSDFDYDLDVPQLRGQSALEDFVLETRTGYCEYFATAMAVMLRATGIPARVAVGFLPGDRTSAATDPQGGNAATPTAAPTDDGLSTFTVSTSDAHAWVEVLFPGYGWIRFEPTPRSDGGVMVPTAADLDPLLTEVEQRAEAAGEAGGPAAPATREEDLNRGLAGAGALAGSGLAGGASDRAGTVAIVGLWLAAGAAVAASAWAVTVFWRRRRRRAERALPPDEQVLAAQRRLHATARRYGAGRRPAETTADLSRRWGAERRADAAAAARFATLAQAAAFGGTVGARDGDAAWDLADTLARDLRGSVPRRERAVAPVRVPAEAVAGGARRAVRRARTLVSSDR